MHKERLILLIAIFLSSFTLATLIRDMSWPKTIEPLGSPEPEAVESPLVVENNSLRLENEALIIENLRLMDIVNTLQAGITDLQEELNNTINMRQIYLSTYEFDLVCRVVAAEARGETYEGQKAVAQVIRDRYLSGSYGGTVADVIYAPGQFAEPWYGDLELYPSVMDAVREVFDGDSVFIGSAIYFFNPATANRGAVANLRSCSDYLGEIGNHEFRGKIGGEQ